MLITLGKYGICFLYFLIIVALAKLFKNKFGAPDEICRKTAHILLSVTWLMFYALFWGEMHFILAPLIGIGVAVVGLKTKVLQVLRRGDSNEADQGIVLYIVTEFILSIFATMYHPALAACTYGMLSIGFGDGFAALVGKKWGKYTPKIKDKKSLAGSMACFLFALLAMIAASLIMGFGICIWKFAILAIVATIVEIFGDKYDNLLIGLCVAFVGAAIRV